MNDLVCPQFLRPENIILYSLDFLNNNAKNAFKIKKLLSNILESNAPHVHNLLLFLVYMEIFPVAGFKINFAT